MTQRRVITSPDDPLLDELCAALAERAEDLDRTGQWPLEQLQACARYGVFEWFIPRSAGGQEWSDADILRGYLRLSAACLTTTFVITQRSGACQRIAGSGNEPAKARWLPGLANGDLFATVGISHLTTSRRHLAAPALSAREVDGGFVLDGFTPWVTGGAHAQLLVVGAALADGRQILLALPTDGPGIVALGPAQLVGLSASHTCEVRFDRAFAASEAILAGPAENVMKLGSGGGTGGLQTSTLAVGAASAAIAYLEAEAARRDELRQPAASFRTEHAALHDDLLASAAGNSVNSGDQLRTRANSLVLRASQAALAAAKGSGYVVGHPAGRWCREALFFLVWSCPQPVAAAQLCQLAGL